VHFYREMFVKVNFPTKSGNLARGTRIEYLDFQVSRQSAWGVTQLKDAQLFRGYAGCRIRSGDYLRMLKYTR